MSVFVHSVKTQPLQDAVIVIKTLVSLHRLLREGPLAFTEVGLARAGISPAQPMLPITPDTGTGKACCG